MATELSRLPPVVRFTEADTERAWEAWKFNCGPAAVCAVTGLTPDEIRPHLGAFEQKGYTNPTLMYAILKSLFHHRVPKPWFSHTTLEENPCEPLSHRPPRTPRWPWFGLARIQWAGPWTAPGVPMRARYRSSHWVASCRDERRGLGIFDVNCMNNGTGWVSFDNWKAAVVPALVATYPRANGDWWITHGLEVPR